MAEKEQLRIRREEERLESMMRKNLEIENALKMTSSERLGKLEKLRLDIVNSSSAESSSSSSSKRSLPPISDELDDGETPPPHPNPNPETAPMKKSKHHQGETRDSRRPNFITTLGPISPSLSKLVCREHVLDSEAHGVFCDVDVRDVDYTKEVSERSEAMRCGRKSRKSRR